MLYILPVSCRQGSMGTKTTEYSVPLYSTYELVVLTSLMGKSISLRETQLTLKFVDSLEAEKQRAVLSL